MKAKLLSALQQKPYFLVLLPVFYIVHGYNDFFGFFPVPFIFLNLIIILLSLAALYLIAGLAFRNKRQTALFSFWALLIILIFGSIHDELRKIFHTGFFSRYMFILPLLFLLFIFIFLRLKKSNSLFHRSFLFLNLLFLFFFFHELVMGSANFVHYKKGSYLLDNRFTALAGFKTQTQLPDSAKPDIYFLVFDAMPSTKAMKISWKYDNGLLDHFLQNEHFFMSENSKSNYNLTVLSVSSTFNMEYTPPVDLSQNETKMYFKASASILDNSLTRILAKEGYDISQFQGISFINKDWSGSLFFKDMLYMNYFYQTLPGRMYRDLRWNLSRLHLKAIENYTLSKYEKRNKESEADLQRTIEMVKKSCSFQKQKPRFVFAHFQLPHDPYIYDSNGIRKPVKETIQLNEEDQPKAFIEQVKYANRLINDLVTFIKATNKKNTVILIEGDHGFRNIYGKEGYMIYDNLNSIYFPDGDYRSLYPSISPVNSFRVVLNKYFTANLPLLKDSSIFIPYTLPGEK